MYSNFLIIRAGDFVPYHVLLRHETCLVVSIIPGGSVKEGMSTARADFHAAVELLILVDVRSQGLN